MTLPEVTEQTSFRYLPWTHNTGRIFEITGDANAYANALEARLAQVEEEKARSIAELAAMEWSLLDAKSRLSASETSAKSHISDMESALASMNAEIERRIDRAVAEERRKGKALAREFVAEVQQAADRIYKAGN